MTKQEEKEILKAKYNDYDPKRHDAFVIRYKKEVDAENLKTFMVNRHIVSGKLCVEVGCTNPAGTPWGPHWCEKHDRERREKITNSLKEISDSFNT